MKECKSKLIGKIVQITDPESIYFEEWGIVDYYDGECYGLRIANGKNATPIFERDQFKAPRRQAEIAAALMLKKDG